MSEPKSVSVISNHSDANLALIWLQGQNISGKTPAQVKEMFYKAWKEICEAETPKW